MGDSPRQTGDSGMVFAHKWLVKGFCEEAKRRQKFAKTLFFAVAVFEFLLASLAFCLAAS
mgnify:CR=1 FL=1